MKPETTLFTSEMQLISRLLRYEQLREEANQQDKLVYEIKKIRAKIETMAIYSQKGTLVVNTIPHA